MENEKRIYVVIANTVQVLLENAVYVDGSKSPTRTVVQPIGRQVAQACHAVSKLRILMHNGTVQEGFEPITTIVLSCRDTNELLHIFDLCAKKKLTPVIFEDQNPEYGPHSCYTALAVLASKEQTIYTVNYLPLWGAK